MNKYLKLKEEIYRIDEINEKADRYILDFDDLKKFMVELEDGD